MSKEMIMMIAGAIIVILVLILIFKYRREYLKTLAYYTVIQAEELYKSKQGQEKLSFAITTIKSSLPWWLSWLISDKLIKNSIENVLHTLQDMFRATKDKQLALLMTVAEDVEKDKLNYLNNEIEKNGYVEGYLEARTNLRGENNVVSGVKAGIKF